MKFTLMPLFIIVLSLFVSCGPSKDDKLMLEISDEAMKDMLEIVKLSENIKPTPDCVTEAMQKQNQIQLILLKCSEKKVDINEAAGVLRKEIQNQKACIKLLKQKKSDS